MKRYEVRLKAQRKGAQCKQCGREASIIVTADNPSEATRKAIIDSGYDVHYFNVNSMWIRELSK